MFGLTNRRQGQGQTMCSAGAESRENPSNTPRGPRALAQWTSARPDRVSGGRESSLAWQRRRGSYKGFPLSLLGAFLLPFSVIRHAMRSAAPVARLDGARDR
jgi:hypothetical protein